jgi:hypothetical protein
LNIREPVFESVEDGFDAIQSGQSGAYTVVVSNALGSVASLPAVLTVTNATGGGRITVTNNTPLLDVDGTTRLAGSNYVAQVYIGPSPDLLRPLGPRAHLRTGTFAGFIVGPRLQIPDVPANSTVYAQMRAWEAAWGACYEEARAAGGKYGCSEIRPFTTKSTYQFFSLVPGFSLRAGLPFFTTGRLSAGARLPDGTPQYVLQGEAGFRYLVERKNPPNQWWPWLVVTNVTGTVVFSAPAAEAVEFFRARLLD